MPVLNIPAGYAECSFVHQQNDTLQPAVCTLGVNTDLFGILVDIGDAWRDHMLTEMNNSFTYIRFLARVTGGLSVSTSYNTPGGGGGSGTSPQVSYLLRKNTTIPGRKFHGRMYYPGCDETSVDQDGRVLSAKLTGLNTMAAAFVTALEGMSTAVQPYLLHNSVTAPTIINSIVAEPVVATQRRRLKR